MVLSVHSGLVCYIAFIMIKYLVLSVITIMSLCSVGFTTANVTEKQDSFQTENCVSDNAICFQVENETVTVDNFYSLPWEDNMLVEYVANKSQIIAVKNPSHLERKNYFWKAADPYLNLNIARINSNPIIKEQISNSSGGLPYSCS